MLSASVPLHPSPSQHTMPVVPHAGLECLQHHGIMKKSRTSGDLSGSQEAAWTMYLRRSLKVRYAVASSRVQGKGQQDRERHSFRFAWRFAWGLEMGRAEVLDTERRPGGAEVKS